MSTKKSVEIKDNETRIRLALALYNMVTLK
jgi:hypothetical protein